MIRTHRITSIALAPTLGLMLTFTPMSEQFAGLECHQANAQRSVSPMFTCVAHFGRHRLLERTPWPEPSFTK